MSTNQKNTGVKGVERYFLGISEIMLFLLWTGWWLYVMVFADMLTPPNPDLHHAIERPATALEIAIETFIWLLAIASLMTGIMTLRGDKETDAMMDATVEAEEDKP